MRRTLLLWICLSATLLAAPSAAAQDPTIKVVVKWAMEHDMVLPESGRDGMAMQVQIIGRDFVCAQPAAFYVEIMPKGSFEKWAGASVVPDSVGPFEFAAGQPGLGEKALPSRDDARLDIAWDLESAPRQGAEQQYTVSAALKPDPRRQGVCLPNYEVEIVEPTPMKVRLPDRPEAQPEAHDCAEHPALCSATATPLEETPATPAPGFVALLVLLLGLARLRRGR